MTINLFAGESHDVVDRLCKVLIGETASTSFYSDEQRAVLARVVPLLRCLPQATNLRDLYVALSVEKAGNELLWRASEAGANVVDIELAKAWFAQPIANRLKNVSGLLNRLFVFVNGQYADRLNAYQPDIDISRAVASNESIYLHLPLTSFAKDVAIAIIETFGVEARKRQLAGTENLKMYPQLFDDWGAFFHIGFGPYSARCRSVLVFNRAPSSMPLDPLLRMNWTTPSQQRLFCACKATRRANTPSGCLGNTRRTTLGLLSPASIMDQAARACATCSALELSRANCASCKQGRRISQRWRSTTTRCRTRFGNCACRCQHFPAGKIFPCRQRVNIKKGRACLCGLDT